VIIATEHLSRSFLTGIFGRPQDLSMIEIFKTNVEDAAQAKTLLTLLQRHFPGTEINFDLEDCDNILRVKGDKFCTLSVIQLLTSRGFACEILAY
jgi:hypothetical protein